MEGTVYHTLTSIFANLIGWKAASLSIFMFPINSEDEIFFPYIDLLMEYSLFQGLVQCPTSYHFPPILHQENPRDSFYPSHLHRLISRCHLSPGPLDPLLKKRMQLFLVIFVQLKGLAASLLTVKPTSTPRLVFKTIYDEPSLPANSASDQFCVSHPPHRLISFPSRRRCFLHLPLIPQHIVLSEIQSSLSSPIAGPCPRSWTRRVNKRMKFLTQRVSQ